jgi:PAS domain S-box-containing protein
MNGNFDGTTDADGDSRVLLAVEDGANRRLLAKFLDRRYTVVDTDDDADDYDLCVADAGGFRRVKPLLADHRDAETPEFLPCLVVVSDDEGVPARAGGTEAVSRIDGDQYVDDVITTPVRKAELRRRTESLLRIRGLSRSLRSREEQYRQLVELTPETILLVENGAVSYVNRAGVELLASDDGDEASITGRSPLSFVVPGDRPDVEAYLDRIERGEAPGEFLRVRLDTPDGEAVVEVAGTPVSRGTDSAVQLVVRDVTEREERERRLRLNQRAMDEASIGITIADAGQADLPMLYANAAFERITGYPTAESIGRNCRFLQGEDTDPAAVAAMREAIEAEEPIRTVVRNYRKDGTPFWNEVEITPVRDAEGAVTHYLGFQRDVTDRIEREQELEALHAATRDLLSASTVEEICDVVTATAEEVLELPAATVFLRDPDADRLVPVAATDDTRELFGELPALSAGDSIAWDVFEDGDPAIVSDVGDDDRAHNPETPVETELIVPLGEHGVFISGSLEADAFGEADRQFVRTLAMNVTAALDRTDREQELRRRKRELERYETIVRATGEPIYTLDAAGNLVDVNSAFVEMVGYSRDRLVGEHVSVLMNEDDVARCEALIADLVASEGGRDDASIEVGVETADGDWRRCLVNIALMPSDGTFRGTVGILRDITERHHRAQRLEVMDRVLRHNLRNEMNVVRGRTEALRESVPEDAAVHLDEILRSANALLSLSEGARRFHEAFHDDDARLGTVDLSAEVRGAVEGLRTRFPDATFETDLPSSAPARAHDAIRICIEELVENAVVHNDSESPTVSVSVTVEDGAVEVAIADDGPGLPASERKTIDGELESALDHASGLGLWLVSWIVTSSGGDVTCDPNDPRGTVVRFVLRSVE